MRRAKSPFTVTNSDVKWLRYSDYEHHLTTKLVASKWSYFDFYYIRIHAAALEISIIFAILKLFDELVSYLVTCTSYRGAFAPKKWVKL